MTKNLKVVRVVTTERSCGCGYDCGEFAVGKVYFSNGKFDTFIDSNEGSNGGFVVGQIVSVDADDLFEDNDD